MAVLQFIPEDLREELIEEVKELLNQRELDEQKKKKTEVSDMMKDFLKSKKPPEKPVK